MNRRATVCVIHSDKQNLALNFVLYQEILFVDYRI